MSTRTIPTPGAGELRAAALAGLAEACVLALPIHAVLEGAGATHLGPAAVAPPFVATYVAGVALACLFRASSRLPPVAAAGAVLAGVLVGGGDARRTGIAVVVALLLALRALALGRRDWGDPIGIEIGLGTAALGAETLIAAGGRPGWDGLLVVLVPAFLLASLSSRATTTWSVASAGDDGAPARSSWIRRTALLSAGVVLAMVAGLLLTVRGGLLERLAEWLSPAFRGFVVVVVAVVVFVARPFFWLVERIDVNPDAFREFLEGLRDFGRGARAQAGDEEPSVWLRLLTLLVLAAVGLALYLLIRRLRRRAEPARLPVPAPVVASGPLRVEEAPAVVPRRTLRRELPGDLVRRRYAEVLIALRARGVPKHPSLTPTEFAPRVAGAFPQCADAFRELTRAYEDVRYGDRRLARDALRGLDVNARGILRALSPGT